MRDVREDSEKKSRTRAICLAGSAVMAVSGCLTLGFGVNNSSLNVSQAEDTESVAVNDAGLKVAPAPDEEFRNESCSLEPGAHRPNLDPGELSIPGNEIETTLRASEDLTLPAAPNGMIYEGSPDLGSDEGKTVTAGHVDYAPGVRSGQGGELSPWGRMHEADPCQRVYAADEKGEVHEFVVTDKFVVGKQDLENSGVFTESGDHKMVMVTCSGESVEDAGEEFQFDYSHNLVIEAVEVKA